MKINKKRISFNYIIIMLFCQFFILALPLFCGKTAMAYSDVNDFYFKSFDADYYLTKDSDGISHLRVVENLTAVFPVNQNKGICRMIPRTNNGGKNSTLDSMTESDIKVLRNGKSEPIYSIEASGKYYEVCTGNDDYVSGEQTYTLEYSFVRAITEYDDGGKIWQELYWNTNGTGWKQRFESLTARVHLDDPESWTGDVWCYVGKYGESGQDRCTINKVSEDTIEFSTEELSSGENLTFDLEFKSGSFTIPDPPKSYEIVIGASIVIIICIISLYFSFKKLKKTANKRAFYKGYFVKPEYQPHPKYSLLELYEIYNGRKKNIRVAILLELITKKQIELIKGDKKFFGGYKWKIRIKEVDSLSEEGKLLLQILAGEKKALTVGEEFDLKSHSPTEDLASMGRRFDSMGASHARRDGLAEKTFFRSHTRGIGIKVFLSIWFYGAMMIVVALIFGLTSETDSSSVFHTKFYNSNGNLLVLGSEMLVITFFIFMGTIAIERIINRKTKKVQDLTQSGLEASRYMDGLKLYIRMAEQDRLNFLQSVQGADTSKEGIVKLYESLLPYAAVFGLEKSWMDELSAYCQVAEIQYMDAYAMHDLGRACRTASHFSSSSTHYSSSSYSGGSGFSGGGGGGCSGGGGGGGGGGGR